MLSLATVVAAVPAVTPWGPSTAIVMIACNAIAFLLGKSFIQIQDAGPASGVFLGLGLPALIAVTSLGHVLGAGAILGLSSIGVI